MVDLTMEEAYAVAELIDYKLIDFIKTDEEIDSLMWIKNAITAYEKLCEYSGYK